MSSRVKQLHFDWIIENVTRDKLENPNFNSTSNVFIIDYFDTLLECQMLFCRQRTEYFNGLILALQFKGHEKIKFYVHVYFQYDSTNRRSGDTNENKICRYTTDIVEFDSTDDGSYENDDLGHFMLLANEKSTIKIRIELELRDKELRYEPIWIDEEKPIPKSYGDTNFADFTLKSSDGEAFKVHQVILAEVSTFFFKLFTVEMKEKKIKTATFSDVNAKTLREVLKFIYTNMVEIDDYDFYKDLLYAAEKFALDELKAICIDKLIWCIHNRNVFDALTTAETFNAKELKEKCIDRIMRNFETFEAELSEEIPADKMAIMKKGVEVFNAFKRDPQFIVKTTL